MMAEFHVASVLGSWYCARRLTVTVSHCRSTSALSVESLHFFTAVLLYTEQCRSNRMSGYKLDKPSPVSKWPHHKNKCEKTERSWKQGSAKQCDLCFLAAPAPSIKSAKLFFKPDPGTTSSTTLQCNHWAHTECWVLNGMNSELFQL